MVTRSCQPAISCLNFLFPDIFLLQVGRICQRLVDDGYLSAGDEILFFLIGCLQALLSGFRLFDRVENAI